jgi:hypothetical protein
MRGDVALHDPRAISVPLRAVSTGQSRSLVDRPLPRWRPFPLVIRPICKQEVRGSNPLGSTSQNATSRIMGSGVRAISSC